MPPRLPDLRIAPNSPLFRMRRSLPRRALPRDMRGGGAPAGLLGSETLPSLGPTSLDHESAPARSHADEKTVCPSSASIVRLERSLHCFWDPLRKVEPMMLSVNVFVVKTCP